MNAGFGWIDLCPHTRTSAFVDHLREGRLVRSRCARCGATSFPPRAHCSGCGSDGFDYETIETEGTVVTFTTIAAAPAGFESRAPYTIGLVDLAVGGRALAWFGESVPPETIGIGMKVRIQPRSLDRDGDERVLYTLELPSTGGPR